MQIKGLPGVFYRCYQKTRSQSLKSEEIEKRKKILGDWELLKSQGIKDADIAKVTGISRATYYRRKKLLRIYGLQGLEKLSRRPKKVRQSTIPKSTVDLVLSIRKQNSTYSKAKICVILMRDYKITLSESSIGRLLKKFVARGLITRSRSYGKKKRHRNFKHHAQRWKYGMRPPAPGHMLQIDHMTVSKNQVTFKHFQAWDPTTKYIAAEVFTSASSLTAKQFLLKLTKDLPFPVKSVQVDGGSEFMQHFEQACADHDIKLYVLPPKRPQYNGGVERTNRIMREEFYDDPNLLADTLQDMRSALNLAVLKHNSYRPHNNLHGLTPLEYTNKILEHQSHML